MDILTAYKNIASATDLLQEVWMDSNVEFAKISVAASELTSISGQEVPSLASHQTLWNNTPPATLEVYRWRAAFVPFVGSLTIELNRKFGTMARAAVQGFLILPVSLKSMTCQQEQLVTNVCFVDLPDA